jgi:hypothetical protein
MNHNPPPPNWGKDNLSILFTSFFGNIYATFHNCPDYYSIIREVADLFELISKNMCSGRSFTPLLLPKAYGSFVAASALSSGGFISEAHAVARTCLECAMRSLYICGRSLAEEYITKHDNEAAAKMFRKKFRQKEISAYLSKEYPHIAPFACELYETTLTFGGHPDPNAVLVTTQISDSDDNIELQCQLITDNRDLILGTVKTVARVGVCSLDMFRELFIERFDILGITERIARLKRQL